MDREVVLIPELLKSIIVELVSKPEEVKVEESQDQQGVLLTLTVSPDDMGKVIGRQGKNIDAIRTIIRAIGYLRNARVSIRIQEPEGGKHYGDQSDRELLGI